jgi:macrolide transport system ATP-binding/permease protein
VEDTVYTDVRAKDQPMTFVPILQRAASDKRPFDKMSSFYAGTIVLETSRPMNDLQNITRRTLSAINPNLTVIKFQTFDEQIADRFTQERMLSRLMMLFGGLALLLATVGLYGVTSYTVACRTSEIGIRMALGADRAGVLGMILRSVLIQSLMGVAIGIPVASYCVQLVKSQLYEITNVSASSIAIAIGTLLVAAFVASLVPGRRAASIDPILALRAE